MKIFRLVAWAFGLLLVSCLLFYLFRSPLLSRYASFFSIHTATKGADAIVCLSGNKMTRVPECLRLWHHGYSQILMVTDEKPRNSRFQELEMSNVRFAQEVTRKMKLKAVWQVLPSTTGGATSTFDEAEDLLAFAKQRDWARIIIVTDEFHTRRANLAFRKVFKGSPIVIEVAGAPNEIFDEYNWWQTDLGILCYLSELIKLPVYWLWDHEPNLVQNS